MSKYILVLVAGIVLGIAVVIGGGYLYVQKSWNNSISGAYQEGDRLPQFDERIYRSTVELAKAKSRSARWIALGDVAIWSVDAGLLTNAENSAEELLLTSIEYPDNWNYGNAVHQAHIALGRVAPKKKRYSIRNSTIALGG